MARNFKEEIVDRIIDLSDDERFSDKLQELSQHFQIEIDNVDRLFDLLFAIKVSEETWWGEAEAGRCYTRDIINDAIVKCMCEHSCMKWLTDLNSCNDLWYYCELENCKSKLLKDHSKFSKCWKCGFRWRMTPWHKYKSNG